MWYKWTNSTKGAEPCCSKRERRFNKHKSDGPFWKLSFKKRVTPATRREKKCLSTVSCAFLLSLVWGLQFTHHFTSSFFLFFVLSSYLPHDTASCSRGHYIFTMPHSWSRALTPSTLRGLFRVVKLQRKRVLAAQVSWLMSLTVFSEASFSCQRAREHSSAQPLLNKHVGW